MGKWWSHAYYRRRSELARRTGTDLWWHHGPRQSLGPLHASWKHTRNSVWLAATLLVLRLPKTTKAISEAIQALPWGKSEDFCPSAEKASNWSWWWGRWIPQDYLSGREEQRVFEQWLKKRGLHFYLQPAQIRVLQSEPEARFLFRRRDHRLFQCAIVFNEIGRSSPETLSQWNR